MEAQEDEKLFCGFCCCIMRRVVEEIEKGEELRKTGTSGQEYRFLALAVKRTHEDQKGNNGRESVTVGAVGDVVNSPIEERRMALCPCVVEMVNFM